MPKPRANPEGAAAAVAFTMGILYGLQDPPEDDAMRDIRELIYRVENGQPAGLPLDRLHAILTAPELHDYPRLLELARGMAGVHG